MNIKIPVMSNDDMLKKDHARIDAFQAYLRERPGAFIGTSLKGWLDEVREAGIACVPAEQIGCVARDLVMHFDDDVKPDAQSLDAYSRLQAQLLAVSPQSMVRWDPCAPIGIKLAMQNGCEPGQIPDDARDLSFGDPRAFDILYEYPAMDVPIFSRPWVHPLVVDGYPLEFRVFIKDSEVIGVASYYLQRPLPENEQSWHWTAEATRLSEKLIASMTGRGSFPAMPYYGARGFDVSGTKIHATLDFLVSQDGPRMLFLEAGPPFGAGAHPCAFEGKEIKGVALAR